MTKLMQFGLSFAGAFCGSLAILFIDRVLWRMHMARESKRISKRIYDSLMGECEETEFHGPVA